MEKILKDKAILVTGTSRGIGRTMVEVFASCGANIIAHARRQTEMTEGFAKEISQKYEVNVNTLYFDLTDEEAIKTAVKELRRMKITVDGLVNNAGIGGTALFQMTRMEELRNIFETDFFGPYLLTQYISKLMTRQANGGSIVSISSTSAIDGNSGKSAYGAAKSALLTMTKCIAEELGGSGIRANVIAPGVTETEMTGELPDYIVDIEKSATYLGKLAEKADIANTAAWLLSDYAEYITGQVIRVDGGKTLYDKRKDQTN